MEAKPGTRVRAKTVKEGQTVDCREWLEFSILEVTVHGIRVRFREQDKESGYAIGRRGLGSIDRTRADTNEGVSQILEVPMPMRNSQGV